MKFDVEFNLKLVGCSKREARVVGKLLTRVVRRVQTLVPRDRLGPRYASLIRTDSEVRAFARSRP